MGIGNRYGIYGVKLDTDSMGGTSVLLGGIKETPMSTGTQVAGEATSGEVFPRFKSITGHARSQRFTTKHLTDGFDNIGLLGLTIASATYEGVNFYAQKRSAGSTRVAGSNHREYNVSDGIVIPRRLAAGHRGDATLDYECISVSPDGSTDPLTITDSHALPSGLADNGRFTLGPVTLGGVSMNSFTNLDIDFGVDLPTEGADSDLYDTLASIEGVDLTITLSALSEALFGSAGIPTTGLACTHANSSIYLRRRAQGASYDADGSSVHIKLTVAGLAVVTEHMQGSPRVGPSIQIHARYDGTNNPLVITTGSTIS